MGGCIARVHPTCLMVAFPGGSPSRGRGLAPRRCASALVLVHAGHEHAGPRTLGRRQRCLGRPLQELHARGEPRRCGEYHGARWRCERGAAMERSFNPGSKRRHTRLRGVPMDGCSHDRLRHSWSWRSTEDNKTTDRDSERQREQLSTKRGRHACSQQHETRRSEVAQTRCAEPAFHTDRVGQIVCGRSIRSIKVSRFQEATRAQIVLRRAG